jgi:hypothetical protein
METIGIEVDTPAEHDDALAADASCSLAMLHAPQAALEAARRLYQRNRSGLRFFCENRRVVPVDQLEALGEFGEFDASAVFAASSPSLPGATRSTM